MKAGKLRNLVLTLAARVWLVLPLLALAFQPSHAAKPWYAAPGGGQAIDLAPVQLATFIPPSGGRGHSAAPSAAFRVTARVPEPNALDVSPTAIVKATFNGDVDPSTVSASTFPVWGAQTGRYEGSYSLPQADRVWFEASAPFKPGEVIVAAASWGVQRSGGGSLTPYLWQFTVAVPCGTGEFLDVQAYDVGDEPQSVAMGDLDGDGDLDLAVANGAWYGTVSVLLNRGDGTFNAQVTYAVGEEPSSLAAGDLDGDGDLDLAVANYNDDSVSVLLNGGDGTFAAQVTYAVGERPRSVMAGDLDGDGNLDLAVANWLDNTVSVLLNEGDGTFAAQVTYNAGGTPESVAAGDLDGDGDLDLAVANLASDTVSVLPNQGDGTFAAKVPYNVGLGPWSVAVGNLDGDGDLELAVANQWGNSVSVLRNKGDGTFAPRVNYSVGDFPQAVGAGDLDGDGDLDLAPANWHDNTVSVLRNRGDGTFAAQVTYPVGDSPRSVAAGDLDGDGDLDLAVTNVRDDTVSLLMGVMPPPTAPSLSSPPDGGSTCDTTPAFQWSPVSEATSYRIQVDDDPDFSSKLINATTLEVSYTPDSALPMDTYYWRVKALAACGDSAWSGKGLFVHMGCGYLPLILREY